jgi:hypothetical protein
MASSLKAYAPLLAWRLRTTPAALYERQRALVRDGILEQSEGRGPGSGVHAAPYSVALLLVAVLATDSLSETTAKVRSFAAAKSTAADGLCPLTRKPTFVEAIAQVLDTAHQHWRKIESISVRRTSGHGVIASGDKLSHVASIFAAQVPVDAKLQATTKLMVDAMLTRDLIIDIAMDLKKIAETQDRARAAALERRAESEQRIQPPRRRKVRANKRRPHEGRKP